LKLKFVSYLFTKNWIWLVVVKIISVTFDRLLYGMIWNPKTQHFQNKTIRKDQFSTTICSPLTKITHVNCSFLNFDFQTYRFTTIFVVTDFDVSVSVDESDEFDEGVHEAVDQGLRAALGDGRLGSGLWLALLRGRGLEPAIGLLPNRPHEVEQRHQGGAERRRSQVVAHRARQAPIYGVLQVRLVPEIQKKP